VTDALARLRALGFSERDAGVLAAHFRDADARGKTAHGTARIPWLAGLRGLDPLASPELVAEHPGFQRWRGRGALGYLTLHAVCQAQLVEPPVQSRLVVVSDCFPTGVLGYWVRVLAEDGLVAVLTATSPRRLGHPDGGPALTGTNPLAIGIPSSVGAPLVADVSMGEATYGDVLSGAATEAELVPFGGAQAHKAFALALGLQLLVDSLAGEGYGAVLLVARPESDPVPALRSLAAGLRLPGDPPLPPPPPPQPGSERRGRPPEGPRSRAT
jgi:LDH2 family malate/lactate/ureidoglycolate dehydrogenase